jgi:hypothetical protein
MHMKNQPSERFLARFAGAVRGALLAALLLAALMLVVPPLAAQSQAPRAQPMLPSPTPAQSAAAQAGAAPEGTAPRAEPRRGGNPPPPFGGHAGDPPLESPPLPVVAGAVPWELLGQVRTVRVKDRFVPEFSPGVTRLDRQDVRIVGFMMPLQPGERQSHFLLTVTSQTCAFCVPAGPEGIVEVRTKTPVKVTYDPVLIAGRLEVLSNDPLGVYYRIGNGEALPIR